MVKYNDILKSKLLKISFIKNVTYRLCLGEKGRERVMASISFVWKFYKMRKMIWGIFFDMGRGNLNSCGCHKLQTLSTIN